jgi:hypothetical protein
MKATLIATAAVIAVALASLTLPSNEVRAQDTAFAVDGAGVGKMGEGSLVEVRAQDTAFAVDGASIGKMGEGSKVAERD